MFKDKLRNCSPTNLNEYLHNNTSEKEVNLTISVNNGSEKSRE
jgi:hypothetical protein